VASPRVTLNQDIAKPCPCRLRQTTTRLRSWILTAAERSLRRSPSARKGCESGRSARSPYRVFMYSTSCQRCSSVKGTPAYVVQKRRRLTGDSTAPQATQLRAARPDDAPALDVRPPARGGPAISERAPAGQRRALAGHSWRLPRKAKSQAGGSEIRDPVPRGLVLVGRLGLYRPASQPTSLGCGGQGAL
jgi:hypothetical protein